MLPEQAQRLAQAFFLVESWYDDGDAHNPLSAYLLR